MMHNFHVNVRQPAKNSVFFLFGFPLSSGHGCQPSHFLFYDVLMTLPRFMVVSGVTALPLGMALGSYGIWERHCSRI